MILFFNQPTSQKLITHQFYLLFLSIFHEQKTIYVENADVAVEIIQKARDNAKIRLNVMER
jgi:hypothetical protein